MIISANSQPLMRKQGKGFSVSKSSQAFPFNASGGVEAFFPYPGGTYKTHIFTATGQLIVQSGSRAVEYVLVAGGGGAGNLGGGGGGGVTISPPTGRVLVRHQNPYPVVVGAGGAASPTARGSNGSNSSFATVSAIGGGAGSAIVIPTGSTTNPSQGVPGGSGGGGAAWSPQPTSPVPGPGATPVPWVQISNSGQGGTSQKTFPTDQGFSGGSGSMFYRAVPFNNTIFRPPTQGGPIPGPRGFFRSVFSVGGGGGGGANGGGGNGSSFGPPDLPLPTPVPYGIGGNGGSSTSIPNIPSPFWLDFSNSSFQNFAGGGGGRGTRHPNGQGSPGSPSEAGRANTGYGGGIFTSTTSPFPSTWYSGGSGIVIVRYNV